MDLYRTNKSCYHSELCWCDRLRECGSRETGNEVSVQNVAARNGQTPIFGRDKSANIPAPVTSRLPSGRALGWLHGRALVGVGSSAGSPPLRRPDGEILCVMLEPEAEGVR